MSWEKERDKAASGGGDTWLSLKAGDVEKVIFLGEPYGFYSVFGDEKRQEFEYKALGSSYRARINVAHFGDELAVKRWEFGKRVFEMIDQAIQKYGQAGIIYEVSRTGSGMHDTKYTVLYDGKCDEAQLKAVGAFELLPLKYEEFKDENKTEEQVKEEAAQEEAEAAEDIPF